MTTTILVTTVFTPNLASADSLNSVLEHLEKTDEGLRCELAQLDQGVQVTTTVLNIADVLAKIQGGGVLCREPSCSAPNGAVAHHPNGTPSLAHNGSVQGKPSAVTPERVAGVPGVAEPVELAQLLEQIQQGKLELYVHVAPEPVRDPADEWEEEAIGQHFRENPFLY